MRSRPGRTVEQDCRALPRRRRRSARAVRAGLEARRVVQAMLPAEMTTTGNSAAAVPMRFRQLNLPRPGGGENVLHPRAPCTPLPFAGPPARAGRAARDRAGSRHGTTGLRRFPARASLMSSASSASRASCHHANGLNQNTARLSEAEQQHMKSRLATWAPSWASTAWRLPKVPIDALRRQQNGRSERPMPGCRRSLTRTRQLAVRGTQRPCGAHQAPRQCRPSQSQQQHAGDDCVEQPSPPPAN